MEKFEFKLPKTGEKVELPSTLKLEDGSEFNLRDVLFATIEKSREEESAKAKYKVSEAESQMAKLREQLERIESERIAAEREKMSAADRAQAELKDMQARMEAINLEKQKSFELFQKEKRNSDLMRAITSVEGVRNADHVARLLSLDASVEQVDNDFKTFVTIGGRKVEANRDNIKSWFEQDGNDIYLSPASVGGAGSKANVSTSTPTGSSVFRREDLRSRPELLAEFSKQVASGQNPRLV